MKLKSRLRQLSKRNKYIHSTLRKINIFINTILKFPRNFLTCINALRKINNLKEHKNIIWFLNVPTHPNLGDQAMAEGIRRWVQKNYSSFELFEVELVTLKWEIFGFIKKMKLKNQVNNIILIQSGYTSSDKTPNEIIHRKIVKNFPKNRIIFFPQTAKYDDEFFLKETAKIYNNHKRLLFLCRDEVSYNQVSKYFKTRILKLYPDIVTTFIGEIPNIKKINKEGVLFCFREDSEKKYSHLLIKEIKKEIGKKYKISHQNLYIPNLNINKTKYYNIIEKIIIKFSNHELIITDRFHGVIFSMVANSKVIALDSIDYKVKEGAKMMNSYFNNRAFYTKDVKNIIELVDNIYKIPNYVLNKKDISKKYNDLKYIVEEL